MYLIILVSTCMLNLTKKR